MPKAGAAPRPFIFVLAGVNGAGKSSVGGALLADHGLGWYNPDSYARELAALLGLSIGEANARAWEHGRQQLATAIAEGTNFAFETTLGARTIPDLLASAAKTHDVVMLYCGLASVELHMRRVKERVAAGGHDIPQAKIHERWTASRLNLVRLLPHLARLQVFDNSAQAAPGKPIADPVLLLETVRGHVTMPGPKDRAALNATPEWARPIVQAAFEHQAELLAAAPGKPPAAGRRKMLQ
jgi:predicted ABC-type ATPase